MLNTQVMKKHTIKLRDIEHNSLQYSLILIGDEPEMELLEKRGRIVSCTGNIIISYICLYSFDGSLSEMV